MKVAVASDHAGAVLHDRIVAELARLGHEVLDTGKPGACCPRSTATSSSIRGSAKEGRTS